MILDRVDRMADMPAIHVDDLSMAYREQPVLWDVDVDVPAGTLTAIVGPNGAGKTTLMKGILGLMPIISGHILLLGEPIDRVRRQIGYVPQKSSVNWSFPTTVEDVVLMGRYAHLGWIRRPDRHDREIAEDAMQSLGVTPYRHRQISELSGGQKQRVFLARAMAQEATLYFLDEPFTGVDAVTERVLVNRLHELRDAGKTILAVHHDLETLPAYFDRVILLNKVVIADGPVDEVMTDDNMACAYGTPHKGASHVDAAH